MILLRRQLSTHVATEACVRFRFSRALHMPVVCCGLHRISRRLELSGARFARLDGSKFSAAVAPQTVGSVDDDAIKIIDELSIEIRV